MAQYGNGYRASLSVIAAVFALVLLPSVAAAQEQLPAETVSGEYIVKFDPNISAVGRAVARANMGVEFARKIDLIGAQVVETKSEDSFNEDYAKKLLASGAVDYIEPQYLFSVSSTPNDTRLGDLWGMHNSGQNGGTADVDIDAPEAWDVSTGSNSIVVGVVDTGVNYNHPDLAANIWTNPNEIAGNGIDDDHNGVVDDIHGFNAVTGSGDPLDDHSHGSHCAGTIGGVGNNGAGVAGVNWRVKIMGLKFLASNGSGTTEDAVRAINYAIGMKNAGVNLRVLSNSWGGGGPSQALEAAVQAANDAGILFVAAAGNAGNDNDASPSYPANIDLPNVISVAAVDRNGNLASFSNFGTRTVDIAAPGVDILSTVLSGNYANFSGTSMATPHIAGVAALLAAHEPGLSAIALKSRMMSTIKLLPTLNGMMVAPGIVSAYRALANIETTLPPEDSLTHYAKKQIAINFDTDLGSRVLNQDDGYYEIALPFNFSFYKQPYTRLAVSANGRIVPLGTGEAVPTTADYSNRLSAGLSVYNDDLYPTSDSQSGVWYKGDGSSVTITWISMNYAHRLLGTTEPTLKFQAKIFASGRIEYHFLDTLSGDPVFDYGASATVGLAPGQGISGERLTVTNNTANQDDVGSGHALSFEIVNRAVKNDFDGDDISDLVVYRPSSGMWYILTSSSNFDPAHAAVFQHGLPGDLAVTGDFDGDGRADMAVWRPKNGSWYLRKSKGDYLSVSAIQWGKKGDLPVAGDFDGDFVTDLTTFRPSKGMFYSLISSRGFDRAHASAKNSQALLSAKIGGKGHDPIVGDFTGESKDNFATVYQSVRIWTVKNSSNRVVFSRPWGARGDTPIACDYDHNGVSDRVMVRPNDKGTLDWFVMTDSSLVYVDNFGSYGDKPTCANDYDGDGKSDLAVFRQATGEWFVRRSSDSAVQWYKWGLPGDIVP